MIQVSPFTLDIRHSWASSLSFFYICENSHEIMLFASTKIRCSHNDMAVTNYECRISVSCLNGGVALLQHSQTETVLQKRRKHVGGNTTLMYTEPLHIVSGKGCYLYDNAGNEYLDCANNVAHVGHCHPKVSHCLCFWPCTSLSLLTIPCGLQSYSSWSYLDFLT